MFAWLSQRITGIILLILLPWKIYSGYALTGRVPMVPGILSDHIIMSLDIILLLTVIFHILYGIRVMLIDIGFMQEKRLFYITTVLGGLFFIFSVYYLYWRAG